MMCKYVYALTMLLTFEWNRCSYAFIIWYDLIKKHTTRSSNNSANTKNRLHFHDLSTEISDVGRIQNGGLF